MITISHATCAVIPPHILRNLGEHGDDNARRRVASTLRQSEQIAGQRRSLALGRRAAAEATARKLRRVYTAENGHTLPGTLELSERKIASGDVDAVEAFENSGLVWDFLNVMFDRDSIDGRGMPLISTVHYGRDFDNAMWDGRQMIYGDGDGVFFTRFTRPIDVAGHEFTHGMTEHSSMLDYRNESGALNEHVSDVVGIMVKQYALGQTAGQSNWLIGEGLFTRRVKGKAIRSMKAPGSAYDDPVLGRDPQPAHMRDYVRTSDDNGGVHINSGIPNRAFYLAATAIGGPSWNVAGRIWIDAATKKLRRRSGFTEMARQTAAIAGASYGSRVQRIVIDAWGEVGVRAQAPVLRRRPCSSSSTTNLKERKTS